MISWHRLAMTSFDSALVLYSWPFVSFDAHTINQFYNTLDIENNEYGQIVNGEVDLDEGLGSISFLGIEWKLHKGVLTSLKAIEEIMRAYVAHVSMDMATFLTLLADPNLNDSDDDDEEDDV
ncbi:Uncharacterized protein TCM_008796 [Theobroma cacao]|uniref:Uncharacterized protein n=1 Tax=Theobroma cacao TaxID=3641 RepID=A0A061E658_THECC|nr:Uncharacterized protein TCM_008796 [Theobroma cacao]